MEERNEIAFECFIESKSPYSEVAVLLDKSVLLDDGRIFLDLMLMPKNENCPMLINRFIDSEMDCFNN